MTTRWLLRPGCTLVLVSALISAPVAAQDDPFADDPAGDEAAPPQTPAEPTPEADAAASDEAEPEAPAEPPGEPAPEPAAAASADASASEGVGVSATATADLAAGEPAAAAPAAAPARPAVITGSHIPRQKLMVDGALIIDSPLRTEVQSREYLQARRQLGGAALPDTTAALGHGGAGTARLELRLQPTLILLNGRRLASAPFAGPGGSDYVDINQIPLQLIERIETTSGIAAGLYGESAMGGVINFITRRDYDGIEVEVGGQATDQFDQGEVDVALTLGLGSERTGATSMVSYFHREPLAASDRDWIGERTERIESLQGSPATFQQISNFDYPIADPLCQLAEQAGHSTGYEVRIRGYGPPENLGQLMITQPELYQELLNNHDRSRGPESAGLRNNQRIDALESSTYCAGDYSGNNDLILKERRLQIYNTFWHKLSDHTEAFAELGYYRSENENRTAPAFPIIRISPDINDVQPLWVPSNHADQPLESYGFAAAEVPTGRIANNLFISGRTQGNFNGDGINDRRVDVWRGVLGLEGDLAGIAPDSVIGSWGWNVSGTYSTSELLARVNDTLMSNLSEALASCAGTKLDADRNEIPTTIKERQEAGCFNPFYSSVVNNAAVDPLNVSSASARNVRGFVTEDSDQPGREGFGAQDGGYICDPADPNSPQCPAAFDQDGDGTFELAGTPNTQQVIDRITGEHFEYQKRTLALIDSRIGGDILRFGGGGLGFGLGGQFRRETLLIDYDQAYNEYDYAFLFGGDDLEPVARNVVGANAELRLRVLDGLVELQPAARIELYEQVGTSFNPMVGVAVRPFAAMSAPPAPLEWLLLRGHIGWGQQAPTLTQLYGQQNEFAQVDYRRTTHYIPHQVSGNPDLDFENYTTISGGVQWDWVGIHVGTDFWTTMIDDVIATDNTRTLVHDCQAQAEASRPPCQELRILSGTTSIAHIESRYENMAEVDTNGVDGTLSYTLDSKRRGLGDFGTFMLAVQGSYINSYMITSPRALVHYYRDGTAALPAGQFVNPVFNADGSRDYSGLTAEYEAAGYRNIDNFAPPIPKLRMAVPLRWMFSGHTVGATMRYVDGYFDDSEYTIEKQNIPDGIDRVFSNDGEKIPAWMVFDLMYGLAFGGEAFKGNVTVGVLNVLGTEPPAVESPLGYEVGLHDPRGRTLYARVGGEF